MALEERMDTVAQTIANGLHALETTATTVQTDLALLSTKQTLSSTKEKVWWAETKRSLVALQSDIMDDRATTTQCLRELRESMQAMTIMMGQMINLVQYHTTVPMMIDTHGGSSPTNAPTPTSQDESATAMILSNLTTTLSTIAVGQETLAGTIIKLNSAVTDMVATNQLQLQSTLAHLTTLTRESSDALAQQSQEDHIHTREMLTNMSESFKEVGITYRPVLQLSPPTTSPDQSKPPHVVTTPKRKKAYRQQNWTQPTLNLISISKGKPLALTSTPHTIQTALALPQPSTLIYPSHIPQPEASLVNQEPIMGTLVTAHEHLIPISTITDYISLAAGMSAEEL